MIMEILVTRKFDLGSDSVEIGSLELGVKGGWAV